MKPNFFHHLHPPTIPAEQARWRHTLAAGGIAVFLVLVLAVTGALEMFYYIPTPAEAPLSIQTLTFSVPFGGLLRNLHYWAAQLLLLVSGVHLLRVVFTAAYASPRRFNYLLGLALFVLLILLDFTGYLLRWDRGIQWALIVGVNLVRTIPLVGDALYTVLVGASQPGSAALIRFYSWHVYGLVLVAFVLTIWHAFRLRRDGGIAAPPPALRPSRARISRYELFRREGVAMLFAGAALLLLSVLLPAPLAPAMTDVTALVSDARAPWFFLWVQQMLEWGDPFLWGVLVPLLVLALLASFPWLFPPPAPRDWGRWFPPSNRLVQVVLAILTLLVLLLTLLACLPAG